MPEQINYWSQLESNCPIKIDRIVKYSKEFEANIPYRINLDNLSKCKEDVLSARGCLDAMIISLVQLLHDKETLKEATDYALFWLLLDNFARFLKRLDDEEDHLIIKFDEPEEKESRVGISRISAYSKILKTASDSLIYESLMKATNEYILLKEEKTQRTFLYILFQVIQVTIAILGGITREKSGAMRKGTIISQSPSWQFLMSQKGQKQIKDEYKDETGVDISDFGDFMGSQNEIGGDLDDEPYS